MVAVVRALWWREVVKFTRDRARLVGALVQPLAFWVLMGLGFYGTFQMPAGAAGPAEVGYMEYLYPGIIALILLFTAIFSTIAIVEDRQVGFLQSALVAPQPRVAIVLGNVLGGTTIALAQMVLFLLLAPTVGITPGLVGLGIVLLGGALTAVAFVALGFLIAWRLDTTRGFHAVMNLLLLPMWFLSGAFFPADSVPALVRPVMYLNPAYYGVAAIREGLYWPAPAPGTDLPVGVALGVAALFAAVLVGLAVMAVKKPVYGE